jgi:uncharacterized protein YhbP (UPF0306 family)
MTDEQIEQAVRENIEKTVHMSLATSKDNKPWVCEVHFAYDDQLNLYYRSLTSRRHSQEIAENPFVAGNIVRQFVLDEAPTGVYFEGTAKLLTPGDEMDAAIVCTKERLKITDEIVAQSQQPDGHQFYKITVKSWYIFGKFGLPSNEKYKLSWNN